MPPNWLSLRTRLRCFRQLALVCLGVLTALPALADFDFEVYAGQWSTLPNFEALSPVESGQSTTVGVSVTGRTEQFGLVFTNEITVPTAGDYEFFTNSDDGSRLYIDGNLVVDNDGLHAPVTVVATTTLAAGTHSLRIEFFERGGGEIIEAGYRTGNPSFEPIPASGELSFVGNGESVFGSWGPVIQWPHIAISASNLPDGRILTWSSTETDSFPSNREFTHAAIFDPTDESFLTVDSDFHDMFCAGIATLENGVMIAAGGNPDDRRTSSFDPATLTWAPRADMNDLRWYGSALALPNNKIWQTFAKSSGNRSELYDPVTNSWTATPNATMQTLVTEQNALNAADNPTGAFSQEWWAHIAVTPQGDVFQGGPTQTWHRFDPIGGAANVDLGQPIGDVSRMYGNAVSYDEGKVILLGGGDRRLTTPTSVNHVYLIDLNGPAPVMTMGAPMTYPRALLNSVTLPNGEILVVGGNTVAKIFNDQGSVLPAEIYTPATDRWRVVDSLSVPRNYHSTALLLKDGRVLSAGGGACGTGCAANHLDGQIFSPPYLFESDNSPAVRPTLDLPIGTQVNAGDDLVVTASGAQSFSIVRLSGTTHHLNTDQRFLPLTSTDHGDGTHTITFPANPNVLIMGNYWLFALDADGTPSVGETIQVVRAMNATPNPAGAIYLSDLPWISETNGWGPAERDRSNGERGASDGGPITLDGVVYPKGIGVHAVSEIEVALAGAYTAFRADIGLDDERDGFCGDVHFEVEVDGQNVFTSGDFVSTTPTQTLDLDVSNANTLTLKVLDNGAACGDHADWADARLIPVPTPGFRYYRLRTTKLRDDVAADSIQLAELSLFESGVRVSALSVENPGGNNPTGGAPAMADDNDVNTKWLDFNRGALVYDYGANVEIDAYGFTTASDVPARDPVRWLFEGSTDGSNWTLLDDQTGADYATPLARLAAIDPIDLLMLADITPLPQAPRNSGTLILETSSGDDRLWNVNPDNDTVSVTDPDGTLITEIAVGDKPWALAKQPGAHRIFVTNKADATVQVIDSLSFALLRTVDLDRASDPHGIVFDASGTHYFVVLEALARLEKRASADDSLVASLPLSGRPRHLAMRFDDSRLLVSNFVTPPISGESTLVVDSSSGAAEVFSVDPVALTLSNTISLTHDDRSQTESQGPGMPNYLGPPVVSFDEAFAYVPSKKDNVRSGQLRQIPGMSFESTVRANTSRIVLAGETEDNGFRIDHDNSSVATGAALSGDNRYLFVTLETSRELAVYDITGGFELMTLPTGRAPQSVVLSSDGSRAFVHNFMDRSVSGYDLTEMLETNLPATNLLATVSVVQTEALSATVLLGKQHFYDAQDDRISLDDYMSCAACHNDGADDGRVWDLGGFGEGLRKTISLRGKGIGGHGRLHWTGNFDEVHDFENQIRSLGLGLGFLNTADFLATSDPLGASKAGLSSDLDALAAYVNSLSTPIPSPHRPTASTLSPSAEQGLAEFAAQGCLSCHSMSQLTDSPNAVRHDIGTIDAASGQRLGAALDGFDTPGLIGIWASPPYLHDGAAATIGSAIVAHDAFASLTPTQVVELTSFLTEAEVSDLDEFLDSDGDGTLNFDDPDVNNACIPTAFVAACVQDTDGDGVSDFLEGPTADTDGDGLFDYAESSLIDTDGDNVVDQLDPANEDECVPDASLCGPEVPTGMPGVQLGLLVLLMAAAVVTLRSRGERGA